MDIFKNPFDIEEVKAKLDDDTEVEVEVINDTPEVQAAQCPCCDAGDKNDKPENGTSDCKPPVPPCPVQKCLEHFKKSGTISITNCNDVLEKDLGEIYLESQGRMLELSFTLKQVCPCKRTAVAIILHEINSFGAELPRGFKTVLIPAHGEPKCSDIRINCIRFVLPETLDPSLGGDKSICNTRRFVARVTANYVDTNFKIEQ